jgi:hypothetical protein
MVNSTFNIHGFDVAVGNVNGTVVAQDLYTHKRYVAHCKGNLELYRV